MLAVHGYYDGVAFRPLEKTTAKPNQRVIITIMDDFVEAPESTKKERLEEIERLGGSLAEYANPALAQREKEAWAQMAVKKHDNL